MFLAITTIVVFCGVSLTFGDKTFGEVRQCAAESYESCKTYCQKYHPNYSAFDKIRQCFEDNRKDFESCMKNQGVFISDSTPCYPIDNSGRKRDSAGVTAELANAAKCYKRCLKRGRKKCRKDCNGQPPGSQDERREKLRECKNEDQILDCLESTGNGDNIAVGGDPTSRP